MDIDNITTNPNIATQVPDWLGKVDQSDPVALAGFISAMPFAKTVTHDELNEIFYGAVEVASLKAANVVLRAGELLVEPATTKSEKFYGLGGTHASYGNFALFWSGRGPGKALRPRPCFMFWDDGAVMLKPGYAA